MDTQIKHTKDETRISLNENIYSAQHIFEAVHAFQDCAKLEQEGNIVVIKAQAGERIALEFFNYLIALRQNDN